MSVGVCWSLAESSGTGVSTEISAVGSSTTSGVVGSEGGVRICTAGDGEMVTNIFCSSSSFRFLTVSAPFPLQCLRACSRVFFSRLKCYRVNVCVFITGILRQYPQNKFVFKFWNTGVRRQVAQNLFTVTF